MAAVATSGSRVGQSKSKVSSVGLLTEVRSSSSTQVYLEHWQSEISQKNKSSFEIRAYSTESSIIQHHLLFATKRPLYAGPIINTARMSVIDCMKDGMDCTPIVFEPCAVDSGKGFGQPESPLVRMMLSDYSDPLKGIGNLKHPSHLPSPSRSSTPTSDHTSSRSTIFSRNFHRLGRNQSRRFHPWSSLVATFFRSKPVNSHSASLPSPLPSGQFESNPMQLANIITVGELNLGPAVSCLPGTLSPSAERSPTLTPDSIASTSMPLRMTQMDVDQDAFRPETRSNLAPIPSETSPLAIEPTISSSLSPRESKVDTLVEALILLKEAEVPLQEKLVFAEEACRMEARQLLTSYAHIAKLTVLIGRLER